MTEATNQSQSMDSWEAEANMSSEQLEELEKEMDEATEQSQPVNSFDFEETMQNSSRPCACMFALAADFSLTSLFWVGAAVCHFVHDDCQLVIKSVQSGRVTATWKTENKLLF